MGKECGTHKEQRKAYRILVRKSKKRQLLEDLGADGSDIKRDNKGRRWERGDRMHLAQDRGKWRAVVNTVMNDRALLHEISPVKNADTSCVIMFTCKVITVTPHMAQDSHTAVLSRTPLTADAWIRSQVSIRDICSGHSGTVTGFSSSTSVLPSISFQQFSISIISYTLLLPEESIDEVWEPSKEQCSFGNRGPLDRKVRSHMQSVPSTSCLQISSFKGRYRHHTVCSSPSFAQQALRRAPKTLRNTTTEFPRFKFSCFPH